MHAQLTIPVTEVTIALDTPSFLQPYGQVTGMTFDNGGPRVTVDLHDGTQLTLAREADTWILGPAEGKDVHAITNLPGYDDGLDAASQEAFNELWRTACAITEQIAAHIVPAIADDLVRLLDRAVTTSPPQRHEAEALRSQQAAPTSIEDPQPPL
ncbi:hypothetical protein [Amycolatopsis anabasis]|uniref:hypothetical protein n=1 Tax=Amycolatopsis anabasis TaxID=1840409 RepID=UPI00131ACE18|nr:hypothetical protein [Amycolatopsis anabasis]